MFLTEIELAILPDSVDHIWLTEFDRMSINWSLVLALQEFGSVKVGRSLSELKF